MPWMQSCGAGSWSASGKSHTFWNTSSGGANWYAASPPSWNRSKVTGWTADGNSPSSFATAATSARSPRNWCWTNTGSRQRCRKTLPSCQKPVQHSRQRQKRRGIHKRRATTHRDRSAGDHKITAGTIPRRSRPRNLAPDVLTWIGPAFARSDESAYRRHTKCLHHFNSTGTDGTARRTNQSGCGLETSTQRSMHGISVRVCSQLHQHFVAFMLLTGRTCWRTSQAFGIRWPFGLTSVRLWTLKMVWTGLVCALLTHQVSIRLLPLMSDP